MPNDNEFSIISPSDQSPSDRDPVSEEKQTSESGTESNSSSNPEHSGESKTYSSLSGSSSDKASASNARETSLSLKDNMGSPTFPVKLHLILSHPEFEKIIAWLPHGRAWRILDHKAVEEKVLPLYFRHGRYSSFARQINGWGFKRIVHGADYNAYYHEMFLRGMPHLCAQMKRPTAKNPTTKEQTDASDPAPDFYAMSRLQPLPEVGAPYDPTSIPSNVDSEPPTIQNQNTTEGQSSDQGLEERKRQILDQISGLLTQHAQQPSGNNQQLSTILSLLNTAGRSGGTQPVPTVTASMSQAPTVAFQQLLTGLGSNQTTSAGELMNSQAQLTALLQQLQSPNQPIPVSANAATPINDATTNSPDNSFSRQAAILAALMNQGGQNVTDPTNLLLTMIAQSQKQQQAQPQHHQQQVQIQQLLQAFSGLLPEQACQQPSSQQQLSVQQQLLQALSSQFKPQPFPMVPANQQQFLHSSIGRTAASQAQHHPQNLHTVQSSRQEGEDLGDGDDGSINQGAAKIRRQSHDEDVSIGRAKSHDASGTNQSSSISANFANLLGQWSRPGVATDSALDVATLLQWQSSQGFTTSHQHKSASDFGDVLSLLQKRNQQGQTTTHTVQPQGSIFFSALQQQNQSSPGQTEVIAGLLQQILNVQNQSQRQALIDLSSRSSSKLLLDALQSLVAPTHLHAPIASPTLSQLQHLLRGQNSSLTPSTAAFLQRNCAGQNLSLDSLAALNSSQGGNNLAAMLLQHLLNKNANDAPSRSATGHPQDKVSWLTSNQTSAINPEFFPSLGLASQSAEAFTGMANQTTTLNQDFLISLGLGQRKSQNGPGTSQPSFQSAATQASANPSHEGQPASSSNRNSLAASSELLSAMGMNMLSQGQSESPSSQTSGNASSSESVAAILAAFNQAKNQKS